MESQKYYQCSFAESFASRKYRSILGALEKTEENDYYLRHIRPPVCPRETNLLPLDGFKRNFIFKPLFENLQKKFSFIKIRKE
jgi:hypothetical protein